MRDVSMGRRVHDELSEERMNLVKKRITSGNV